MDSTSFISTKMAAKLLKILSQVLNNSVDKRNQELVRINDVFGDCEQLAKYYIQPFCQQVNPADEIEDETISSVRAGVFETINKFLNRDVIVRDGASQMFILADAGMGKTSLLMMLKLSHLMAFWPKDYQCYLFKLGPSTLDDIAKIENKTKTVLLLDSLDEDNQCKLGGTSERLTEILEMTARFHRVIITCRTQFFPDTAVSAFGNLGKISFNNYDCPLIYLSLFTDEQVDSYLEKRYPRKARYFLNKFHDPRQLYAKQVVRGIDSLQFRPFILSHIDTLLESHRKGASEYDLYKGLVTTWLNREVIKLREHHGKEVSRDDLLKACIWLAEMMHRHNTHTVGLKHIKQMCHRESSIVLLNSPAERVIEGIDHIDIGTNSLLNRNSFGEFRFSHLSIREFLIVYGIQLGVLKDENDPFFKTDKMLSFIKTVNKSKVGLFFNMERGYLLPGFELIDKNKLSGFDLKNACLEHSDLREGVFKNENMEGADLRGANLSYADLSGACLKGAILQGANLQGVNLRGANLEGADLAKAIGFGANFDGANLEGANISQASFFTSLRLSSEKNIATFRNATLTNADLTKVNLECADLQGATLNEAKIFSTNLSRANLHGASLGGVDLKLSDLHESNLENASLKGGDLRSVNLTGAVLIGANFSGADLTQAKIDGSNISDMQLESAIIREKYENKKPA